MFLVIIFWLLLFALTPLILPSLSIYLSYLILVVPMCECLGKHSCMSSPFPIAMLNGTLFFCETTWSKWSKSRLSKTNYYNNNGILGLTLFWLGMGIKQTTTTLTVLFCSCILLLTGSCDRGGLQVWCLADWVVHSLNLLGIVLRIVFP